MDLKMENAFVKSLRQPIKAKNVFTLAELHKVPFTPDDYIRVLLPRHQEFKLLNLAGEEINLIKINRRLTKAVIFFFQYLKAAKWTEDFKVEVLLLDFPHYGMGFKIVNGEKINRKLYHYAKISDLFIHREKTDMIISKIKDFNKNVYK